MCGAVSLYASITAAKPPTVDVQSGPGAVGETVITFSKLALSVSDNPIKHTKSPAKGRNF